MILYRGQPTSAARVFARGRLSPWLRAALDLPETAPQKAVTGRWFTDKLEIARWYAADANGGAEIVRLELSDEVAEAFRVSRLTEPLPGGADPIAYSRDPEREFMLPAHIAARAVPMEMIDDGIRNAA